ncbi:hypothetical protein [Aliamphritea spongicola]|nr:hypothetical protein [Aliamphritea spongicola]
MAQGLQQLVFADDTAEIAAAVDHRHRVIAVGDFFTTSLSRSSLYT